MKQDETYHDIRHRRQLLLPRRHFFFKRGQITTPHHALNGQLIVFQHFKIIVGDFQQFHTARFVPSIRVHPPFHHCPPFFQIRQLFFHFGFFRRLVAQLFQLTGKQMQFQRQHVPDFAVGVVLRKHKFLAHDAFGQFPMPISHTDMD